MCHHYGIGYRFMLIAPLHLSLCCLDGVGELKERSRRCVCICSIDCGLQVLEDGWELTRGVDDGLVSVESIQDSGLWHGCNGLAQGCEDLLVICLGCDTFTTSAANCFVMRHHGFLEELAIHRCSHDQRRIHRLQHAD